VAFVPGVVNSATSATASATIPARTRELAREARRTGCSCFGLRRIAGLVLNKTDKRTEQHRKRCSPIVAAANRGELPLVFDAFIPDTPKLATATDDGHFDTLKGRFGAHYDHVRPVTVELEKICKQAPAVPPPGAEPEGFKRVILRLLRTVVEAG
jgi:hypothetical protein